jgi:hypothetical protein
MKSLSLRVLEASALEYFGVRSLAAKIKIHDLSCHIET